MALKIFIPFDEKKMKLLPGRYASKYGAPTFISPKSDCEVWERGEPYAERKFKYSKNTIKLAFVNGESGGHDVISIVCTSPSNSAPATFFIFSLASCLSSAKMVILHLHPLWV